VLPAPEDCDGSDNDCNGHIDDVQHLCGCEAGDHRDCYSGPAGTEGHGPCRHGHQECNAEGAWSACHDQVTPVAETCNGVDDDCDDRIDDTANAGQPCTVGQGACQSVGTMQCSGPNLACVAPPGPQPQAEVCNGIDDDCNGHIDDGTVGSGRVCEDFDCVVAGTTVCVGGVMRCECLL
jgi:hypothetical protein